MREEILGDKLKAPESTGRTTATYRNSGRGEEHTAAREETPKALTAPFSTRLYASGAEANFALRIVPSCYVRAVTGAKSRKSMTEDLPLK